MDSIFGGEQLGPQMAKEKKEKKAKKKSKSKRLTAKEAKKKGSQEANRLYDMETISDEGVEAINKVYDKSKAKIDSIDAAETKKVTGMTREEKDKKHKKATDLWHAGHRIDMMGSKASNPKYPKADSMRK